MTVGSFSLISIHLKLPQSFPVFECGPKVLVFTLTMCAGFPRTEKQAMNLMASYPVDIALNIVVPFDVIVERVQGRWVHLPSGRVYNTGFKPPHKPVSKVALMLG